ncbi:MAG: hypothetical protein J1G01_03365 [Clostridiales bacterium]|nr:hypothetical protein [Clostridiales bacterium]
MYNKKSRVSAIMAITNAALFIGFMIMFSTLTYNAEKGGLSAAFFIFLFGAYGSVLVYASAIPFVLVSLIFGINMLFHKTREKLISYNKRLLIATCVLLPFIALGLTYVAELFLMSAINLFSGIYTFFIGALYVAGLITQIVTIVVLKKSSEESTATDSSN